MDSKNILYIGPYREFTGAGHTARNYIQALFEAGHDICIAPIFYTGEVYPENEISSDILPLETNYLKRYDVVIQHCHPFDYIFSSKFEQNIGIYQFNCANIHPGIINRLKLMDRIVINSKFNHKVLHDAYPLNNIHVVPELIDHKIKDRQYVEYSWLKTKNKPIIFYTIGDFIERKNIHQIIKAFIHTFHKNDNVQLIIKTKPHFSHKQHNLINQEIEYTINKIYSILRKNKNDINQPKIMVGQFEYDHLLALHQNANIYIDASMAENFGYSVLEAATMDNYLIVNENSSTSEISDKSIKTRSRPIQTNDSYSSNFIDNTINNFWYEVDFNHLCKNMLRAYHEAIVAPEIPHNLKKYNYSNVESMIL